MLCADLVEGKSAEFDNLASLLAFSLCVGTGSLLQAYSMRVDFHALVFSSFRDSTDIIYILVFPTICTNYHSFMDLVLIYTNCQHSLYGCIIMTKATLFGVVLHTLNSFIKKYSSLLYLLNFIDSCPNVIENPCLENSTHKIKSTQNL